MTTAHPGVLPRELQGSPHESYRARTTRRLRRASRHRPTPAEVAEWPATPENVSRVLGSPLEPALRAAGDLRPWHFDPEFPISLIRAGLPRIAQQPDGTYVRADTGEGLAEFRRIVTDYEAALSGGSIFPPILVTEVRPEAERSVLGPAGWRQLQRAGDVPELDDDHFAILNGRHRVIAARRLGLDTFPAYVWASRAEALATIQEATAGPPPDDAGERRRWLTQAAQQYDAALARLRQGEAEVLRIAAERGRQGYREGPLSWAG